MIFESIFSNKTFPKGPPTTSPAEAANKEAMSKLQASIALLNNRMTTPNATPSGGGQEDAYPFFSDVSPTTNFMSPKDAAKLSSCPPSQEVKNSSSPPKIDPKNSSSPPKPALAALQQLNDLMSKDLNDWMTKPQQSGLKVVTKPGIVLKASRPPSSRRRLSFLEYYRMWFLVFRI